MCRRRTGLTDGCLWREDDVSPLARRFPHLETVEAVMRAVLKDPGAQFDMVAPSTLLDAVSRSLPDGTGT